MNRKHLLLSLILAGGASGLLNSSAQAQPDPNAAPKGENPPNWNWNPGQGGGGRGGRGGLRVPITPEQIQRFREQQAQVGITNIKSQLTRAGFTDEALQTAVVNAHKEQTAAQTDLTAKWQKITTAIRLNNTNEADMAALLKDFRDAVDKEQARRAATAKSLEDQYQVSKKPLLDAILMTMGLTGNEASAVGQANGGGMGQIMNLLGGMGGPGGLGALLGRNGARGDAEIFRGRADGNAPAPADGPPVIFW